MEIKLKPCPFCGRTAPLVLILEHIPGYGEGHQVVCSVVYDGCGASSGFEANEEDAIEAWNQRRERKYRLREKRYEETEL